VAPRGRQAGLDRRRPDAPQCVDDRQADMACEIPRLIEPAFTPTRRVQRDGDRGIGPAQHVRSSSLHRRPELRRQRPPAVVLERMNDRAQRAIVRPDRARLDDPPVLPPAARAFVGRAFIVRSEFTGVSRPA
jgi:hypothetical protein